MNLIKEHVKKNNYLNGIKEHLFESLNFDSLSSIISMDEYLKLKAKHWSSKIEQELIDLEDKTKEEIEK